MTAINSLYQSAVPVTASASYFRYQILTVVIAQKQFKPPYVPENNAYKYACLTFANIHWNFFITYCWYEIILTIDNSLMETVR